MQNNLAYKYSSIPYRDRKYQNGYQFDFMVLEKDNKEYPFINIYYFKDEFDYESYKITIDGNLEIGDSNLKSNNCQRINGTLNLLFKSLVHSLFLSNTDDMSILNMHQKLVNMLREHHSDEYEDMIRRFKEYSFLIKHAISKSLNLEFNEINCNDLVIAIRSLRNSKKNK